MPIAGRATKFFRRASATLAVAVITVAAATACDSRSPAAGGDDVRQVTVVGSGSVQGTPDTLTADFGIEFTAPDVTTAMKQTSERVRTVIDSLVEAGVERKDITTTNVDVQPITAIVDPTVDADGTGTTTSTPTTTTTNADGTTTEPTAIPGTPRIVAFRATNSVSVEIRDTENASQVLAIIVNTGQDATRLNSVEYSINDDSQLVKDARARAFNDAKDRAEQYAELSELQLGRVISISEAAGSTGPEAPRAALTEVPLEPGQQTVSFAVTVVWELT